MKLKLDTHATDVLTHSFSSFWAFQPYQPISNKFDSKNTSKISNYHRLCSNLRCHHSGTTCFTMFYHVPTEAGPVEGEKPMLRSETDSRDGAQAVPQHPGVRCQLSAWLLLLERLVHAWKPVFQGDLNDFQKRRLCPWLPLDAGVASVFVWIGVGPSEESRLFFSVFSGDSWCLCKGPWHWSPAQDLKGFPNSFGKERMHYNKVINWKYLENRAGSD